MPNDFTELRNNSYVGSALCPECPTKDWRGKSCWINPRESNPEVVQGLGGVTTHIRPYLSRLGVEPTELYGNCC